MDDDLRAARLWPRPRAGEGSHFLGYWRDGEQLGLIELRKRLPGDNEPVVKVSAQEQTNAEVIVRFSCFGGSCAVLVAGDGPRGSAPEAVASAKQRLLEWHQRFSRFNPASELSALNRDPREVVPVSPMMALFVQAALDAAQASGGLVDPTLVGELELAGYEDSVQRDAAPALDDLLELAPVRTPARPRRDGRWRAVQVDLLACTVSRPRGTQLDSGGIVKGLFGDILAISLSGHASFVVDAGGDLRLGGAAGTLRPVQVSSPSSTAVLHTFELASGAVATSGITRRSWRDQMGHPAHHLLDPATGSPAFTGIVQVTALAPVGVEAEGLAKAALLSGPGRARNVLAHGGVVLYDDGDLDVIEPRG